MKEIWKDILNCKGYQVSNYGRVKSLPKKSKECWNVKNVILKKDNKILNFDTEKEASEYLGVSKSAINNVLNKRSKKCKGYEVYYG